MKSTAGWIHNHHHMIIFYKLSKHHMKDIKPLVTSLFSKSAMTFSAGEQINSQLVIPFAAAFNLASSMAEASISTPINYISNKNVFFKSQQFSWEKSKNENENENENNDKKKKMAIPRYIHASLDLPDISQSFPYHNTHLATMY